MQGHRGRQCSMVWVDECGTGSALLPAAVAQWMGSIGCTRACTVWGLGPLGRRPSLHGTKYNRVRNYAYMLGAMPHGVLCLCRQTCTGSIRRLTLAMAVCRAAV